MQTFTMLGSNIANSKPYPCPLPSSIRKYSRASVRVRATYATEAPSNAQAPAGKNQLDALKEMSKVVADTGEIDAIKNYKPHDVTTNPRSVLAGCYQKDCAGFSDDLNTHACHTHGTVSDLKFMPPAA